MKKQNKYNRYLRLELGQEAKVVAPKFSYVFNGMAKHGNAFRPHSKGKA
jgi:phage gp16-like protein